MIGWDDLDTALDAVGFARRRLGFEPDALQAEVMRSVEAAVVELLAAVGQEHRVGDRGAVSRVVPAGATGSGDGPSERQTAEFVRKVQDFLAQMGVKARGDGHLSGESRVARKVASGRWSVARWNKRWLPATEGPRISKEFLEEEVRTQPDNWFRQECGCEFVQDFEGLFDMDLVDKAFEDY